MCLAYNTHLPCKAHAYNTNILGRNNPQQSVQVIFKFYGGVLDTALLLYMRPLTDLSGVVNNMVWNM